MLATLICTILPFSRRERRLHQEIRILATIAVSTDGLSGAQIHKATGIWSGALYPALVRLEGDGVVTSAWADEAKPRRRIYRTAEGRS